MLSNYTLIRYNSGVVKPKETSRFHFVKLNLLPVFLSSILLLLILIAYQVVLADKFYPLTFVGDTNISFLTEGQAIKTLQSAFGKRVRQKLAFSSAQGSFTIDLATSSATLDYSALDTAFKDTRQGTIWEIFQKELQTLIAPVNVQPKISLSLDKQLAVIESGIFKAPLDAQLIFDETPTPESTAPARIQIKEAENGLALDKAKTLQIIRDFLLTGNQQSQLPTQTVPPKITTALVEHAKTALETTLKEPIKLIFDNKAWVLDTKQLLTLLDLLKGEGSLLDKNQTNLYLKGIAQEIDQGVQEGLFDFNPVTHRVSAFRPSSEGRKLDTDKTFQLINEALSNNQKLILLPVDITKPKIETADINSLGIKELLGRGISNFAGSIPNRIYNISLTASKINGVLVPPGQIFSFNQTVGDISAATGFKQAYVIKEGRTILDDGGGVCQDSTTLFRAVLNAGLPVVKRTAHAYRVGYYEQGFPPGLDATVFYPSVDFQFKNDTANHILIQASTVGNTLYVDLYGSSDGRITNITQPVVTDQTPPPPDLKQDDPALPRGTVKQVDWAAWGANVSFKRTVTRNGQTLINETWKSSFKPWQAVYLIGTQ